MSGGICPGGICPAGICPDTGCHIGGHFVGTLAYAGDVTLVAPSRSGIRTLINVCEQFALDYEITYNGI